MKKDNLYLLRFVTLYQSRYQIYFFMINVENDLYYKICWHFKT